MAKNGNVESKYPNKTIASFFPNEKFGEGALKSAPLTPEGYDVMQDMGIGYSLILRPGRRKDGTPVTTKDGEQVYYLEKLAPRNEAGGKSKGRSNKDDL